MMPIRPIRTKADYRRALKERKRHRLTFEALADVDAGRVVDHRTVKRVMASRAAKARTKAWKQENRAAIEAANEYIAEYGLPLLHQLVAEGRASGQPVEGKTTLKRLRAKYVARARSRAISAVSKRAARRHALEFMKRQRRRRVSAAAAEKLAAEAVRWARKSRRSRKRT